MQLNKNSHYVIFNASLVSKGIISLDEVSEANGLKTLVSEVLFDLGYFRDEIAKTNKELSKLSAFSDGLNVVDDDKDLPTDSEIKEVNKKKDEKLTPGLVDQDDSEDIDPVDNEFKPEGSIEDNEVRGIGRATEIEKQDFNENTQGKGGFLPR